MMRRTDMVREIQIAARVCFRDPCIGDKDVQAISDDGACLPGKLAGAVRGGEVHRYGIRSATAFAYLCDNSVGFLRAAAVVDENLGAGGSERECARAPHAARSAAAPPRGAPKAPANPQVLALVP